MMVHYFPWNGRKHYGPSSPRQRHDDKGNPSSDWSSLTLPPRFYPVGSSLPALVKCSPSLDRRVDRSRILLGSTFLGRRRSRLGDP
ncbi:MAG: hypothetical protein COA37_00740 [Hoeflea sp.]|nr:MAG: hypothetical protein COA37_00740 [Hoeflea sp.]